MRNRLITLLFVLSSMQLCFGQEISIYKTFGGFRFERDSMAISSKMVLRIMEDNPPAYAAFKRAKTNFDAAGVLGFVGGFLIAFPLGTVIAGGNPEWGFAVGGLGLILASIPLTSAFKGHALDALDIYNSNPQSSRRIKANFYLAGIGGKLVIRF